MSMHIRVVYRDDFILFYFTFSVSRICGAVVDLVRWIFLFRNGTEEGQFREYEASTLG